MKGKDVKDMTQSELAVFVLYSVTNGGWDEAAMLRGLHECDLAVRLWKLDQEAFGMFGYKSDFPDRKVVSVLMCGKKGPVGKGWVERCGPGRVRLTLAGLDVGKRLTGLLDAAA